MRSSRPLVLSFILTCAVVTIAANVEHRSLLMRHLAPLTKELPPDSVMLDTSAAPKAKRRGFFWILFPSDLGAAISLRQKPALFDEVFPGYEAARVDEEFWRRYMTLDFESRIYAPSVSASASGAVMTSWGGSLELFRRFGADIVLIGSSETYNSLVPSILARSLGGKVLSCAGSGMRLEQAGKTAHVLAESG